MQQVVDTGTATSGENEEVTGAPSDTGTETDTREPATLLVAPLIYATTTDGFTVNAVTASGDPTTLRLYVQEDGPQWQEISSPAQKCDEVIEWRVSGRLPGSVYPYAIVSDPSQLFVLDDVVPRDRNTPPSETEVDRDGGLTDDAPPDAASPDLRRDDIETPIGTLTLPFVGQVVTQRAPSDSFRFALIADSHLRHQDTVEPEMDIWNNEEAAFFHVISDVAKELPDFIVHLGDIVDYRLYGFNDPPPDAEISRLSYLNYRRLQFDRVADMTHFTTIGNWDGENGDFTETEIERSRSQRLLYLPNPSQDTYPEGGSKNADYYAFTWGDALFIVLNVMTYTATSHRLSEPVGEPDDWTLGEAQLSWLEEILGNAVSKWRFVLIHHPVGGMSDDPAEAAYGRGGGLAAHVGEQAQVHELMRTYGVQIFFYGHDHYFTDMFVDSIHYTLPGSAGVMYEVRNERIGETNDFFGSGHGLVTVTPEQVQVEFVGLGGALLHRFVVE